MSTGAPGASIPNSSNGRGGINFKSSNIFQNFTSQLQGEIKAGGVLNPPSSKKRLFEDDGSDSRAIGASTNLAKRARLSMDIRGMPESPLINQLSIFNPRGGSMTKPPASIAVHFQDDAERVYEWPVNDGMVWKIHAQLIHGNYNLTQRCLGQFELAFVQRQPRSKERIAPPSLEESSSATLCSVSMLNSLYKVASKSDAKHKLVAGDKSPKTLLDEWVFFGSIWGVSWSGEARTRGMPLVNCILHNWVDSCPNYWAACVPKVRDQAYLWFNLVRRPVRGSLASKYRDLVDQLQCIDIDAKTKSSKDKTIEILKSIMKLDKLAGEGEKGKCQFYWRYEPWVTYTPEEPPAYSYSGHNWTGACIKVKGACRPL